MATRKIKKQRFGYISGIPVYIMPKNTNKLKRKDIVVVQSLIDGNTGFVKKSQIKKLSYKYPKRFMDKYETKKRNMKTH